jgi:hypothetical protein
MKIRLILLSVAIASTSVLAHTKPPVAQLVARASAYAFGYMRDFSTVVAEEQYVQDARPMTGPGDGVPGQAAVARHVELRSDLLFVRRDLSDNWLTFRDVFSVNGRTVRDRVERLTALFVDHPGDALDRAAEIVREGYRYDIASPDRTVANPLLALAFLQPVYVDRFEFTLAGIDTARHDDVWIVKFRERVKPTIIRSKDNRNVPASGRLWIDGGSGRVLQTEIETNTGDRVMTIFSYDERLQMDVPAEMRDLAWYGGTRGTVVTGAATYTNFRRFAISTDTTFR